VRPPRQAQRPQPSPPGLHRRRPRRSAPPKRRVSVRSWGRIARRLELGERVLRRLGCFGARESYYPCPARARLAAIGKAVLLAFGRFIVRPPDERSLRIQCPRPTVSILGAKRSSRERRRLLGRPHRPATAPFGGRRVLDPRISSPRRSERCSFACGLRSKEVEQRGVDLVGVRPRNRCGGRPQPGRASRPWKAEILHWERDSRASGPPSPTRIGHSARRHFRCERSRQQAVRADA
jgi:hypothetical protein